MAWSWSHSADAYDNARANLELLPASELLVIAAEWSAAPADADPETFSHWHYVRALARLRRLDLAPEELAEIVWDRMEQYATCTNGGHLAWACPYGCGPHLVNFDSPAGAEELAC